MAFTRRWVGNENCGFSLDERLFLFLTSLLHLVFELDLDDITFFAARSPQYSWVVGLNFMLLLNGRVDGDCCWVGLATEA
jgi:hypothetical protein